MRTIPPLIVLALMCGGAAHASGQTQSSSPAPDAEAEARRRSVRQIADSMKRDVTAPVVPKGWKPARTLWGDPDIEGVYTNIDEWGIPFQPPAEFTGRRLDSITPQELERTRQSRRDAFLERLANEAPAEPGTIGWYENLNVNPSRAWLIADPPDGRIPPFTLTGERRSEAQAQAAKLRLQRNTDSAASQALYPRCITKGFPASMLPEAYGSTYHVHQAPGYVAIRYEHIHETHVIPLDGRRRLADGIQSYLGDGRGRWEGDTLVVETTNFKPSLQYFGGALAAAFRGLDSAALRLVGRFTPVSPTTMQWSVTVDEPSTWVRPWTFAINLTRAAPGQKLYEYACHEGNYGMRNILSTARALEGTQRR